MLGEGEAEVRVRLLRRGTGGSDDVGVDLSWPFEVRFFVSGLGCVEGAVVPLMLVARGLVGVVLLVDVASAGSSKHWTWPDARPTAKIGAVGCVANAMRSDESGRLQMVSNIVFARAWSCAFRTATSVAY